MSRWVVSKGGVLSAAIVLAATAIGVVLRFHDIDRESFWLDEAGRAAIAQLPLGEIAHGVSVVELSPPLYHFLLHGWIGVVGGGDVAIRAFSALLVIPTVPLAWWVGALAGGRAVGALAAILAAVNPFAVHFGQEAAMYALLLPLALATTGAAMMALSGNDPQRSAEALRRRRANGLAMYVLLATCTLYTHYYALFLLGSVALVGIGQSVARRATHGTALWVGAHIVIGLAFLPWVPTLLEQASLASSVRDWTAISLPDAGLAWSVAAMADGASAAWSIWTLIAIVLAAAVGLLRLDPRRPSTALLGVLIVLPLVIAALISGLVRDFRERGLMVALGPLWIALAAASAGGGGSRRVAWFGRMAVCVGLALATVVGLEAHYAQSREDWRRASAVVASTANPNDPIFFVLFGTQIPFDRYYHGSQPRIGLPDSFSWADGYRAPYLVSSDDVRRRSGPALVGQSGAWAVLSHDEGRGSDRLLAALDAWGARVSDQDFDGVRVVHFVARA